MNKPLAPASSGSQAKAGNAARRREVREGIRRFGNSIIYLICNSPFAPFAPSREPSGSQSGSGWTWGRASGALVRNGLLAVLLLVFAAEAFGRPGGGGNGGGGAMLIFQLIALLFHYPLLGVIVVVLVVLFLVLAGKQKAQMGWSTSSDQPEPLRLSGGEAGRPAGGAAVDAIRNIDPAFSLVTFEDFLYTLYTEFQRARGTGALGTLSPYLAPGVIAAMPQGELAAIDNVVIGAMRILEVSGTDDPSAPRIRLRVLFEANYTEAFRNGFRRGMYSREIWTMNRDKGARSRPPDKTRSLGCPGCGAPVDAAATGQCAYCGRQVNNGAFDWLVQSVSVLSRDSRAPLLTADVAEEGTDRPTRVDPNLGEALSALQQRDPGFSLDNFMRRLYLVFGEFQKAWTARDLAGMRPFLSDNLFQTQVYWVNAYRTQRLRNITENARITGVEPVKLTTDAWFDSLTVRVFATGLDYTMEESGRLVSGSRTMERAYSEYWTFVRAAGKAGAARADLSCPRCGAPLDINMAGVCAHCTARVTSGEFDWVLSRIEQDESYVG